MTMTDDRLRRMLEELGTRPVPPLSRDAGARLDHRIAALTGSRVAPRDDEHEPPSSGVVVAFPRRHRRARVIATAAVAAVAAVIVAAVLAGSPTGWFETGPDPDLALASARNATVLLPDGSAVTARVGLTLPEGAIVTTGPGGHAVAGGVELGPHDQAVVSDGELEPAVTVPSVSTPTAPTESLPTAPPILPTVPALPLP